jgi:23S rRNA maturation mini-RNase III
VLKELQRPIRMHKKTVAKKEAPTQEAIDAAERMAALLEEEEEEEKERENAAAAKSKVRSRPAFSHPC